MTQAAVKTLLGTPDETSASTFGQRTATPWQGITWFYYWPGKYDPPPSLKIIFEQTSDGWVVNSWDWAYWP